MTYIIAEFGDTIETRDIFRGYNRAQIIGALGSLGLAVDDIPPMPRKGRELLILQARFLPSYSIRNQEL